MFKSAGIQHVCFRNTLALGYVRYNLNTVPTTSYFVLQLHICHLFEFFLCSRIIREIKRVSCSVSGRYFEHLKQWNLQLITADKSSGFMVNVRVKDLVFRGKTDDVRCLWIESVDSHCEC